VYKYYQNEFERIANVTILDSASMWEHSFNNESYQAIVSAIVDKYLISQKKIELANSQNLLVESFV